MSGFFERSEALLGAPAMTALGAAHVLVVGVGGVGSWCAEALVRTGIGRVTLVDDDAVAPSNVNRQCQATALTVGRPKVEAMAERLREINPSCGVTALPVRYPDAAIPPLGGFAAVVDAIDSVDGKAELILAATAAGTPLVSSMGAAFRIDPTQVRVTRFEKVEGDGLARALRRRFKRLGRFPSARFSCVWSAETPCATSPSSSRGSLMPVTATFGLCLASKVIQLVAQGVR